jgi:hypothetical protein
VTKTNKAPSDSSWTLKHHLPIFLVGGGARSDLHIRVVNALDPWLRENARNDGIRITQLPRPTNLTLPLGLPDSNGFERLAVAWGLSYPPTEIGEIALPSQIGNIPRPVAIDSSGRFVSKDQV